MPCYNKSVLNFYRIGGVMEVIMKALKELKFEELTVKQKLGMVYAATVSGRSKPENIEFARKLISEHSLGAIWIQWNNPGTEELMKMVKETADYPILIFSDAENGMENYRVGQHNAIGCTDSEELAYTFGKVVGITAKKKGYNFICNPLLDIKDNGWSRALGSDKYKIAKLAAAEARGLHDAGILTCGKHYPSSVDIDTLDSHLVEPCSLQTKEELLDHSLYAYIELIKENLLDGLMPGHHRMLNIDPTAPASLSRPVLDIIREEGFDGVLITDALCMMGILAKYGKVECKGLSIAAGNDLALPYDGETIFTYSSLCECYEKGMIPDDVLDAAVKRVLAAQHKVMLMQNPKCTEITEEDKEKFSRINKDSVYAKVDEGASVSIPRESRNYFVLMARNETTVGQDGGVAVDTFSNGWHYPAKISAKIKELFPNSEIKVIYQFPTQGQMSSVVSHSLGYDNVVFLTFSESLAYTGKEHLTRRVVTLIEAMQNTDRISTLLHFGNPKVLEELPHIPRVIFGGVSEESINTTLEVLAGEYEPKGHPTYEINLK